MSLPWWQTIAVVWKRTFEMRKIIDSLGRVQSMDSYMDAYNITACRLNYQLSDGSIFEQLYREDGKSYDCRSCARTQPHPRVYCKSNTTLERCCVLAIFARNVSVRRLQFSDKMINFRTALTIGIQKQSQILKVGYKDAFLLFCHASKL